MKFNKYLSYMFVFSKKRFFFLVCIMPRPAVLFLLSLHDAYIEAKCLLEEKFGDPFLFSNKDEMWPKVLAGDGMPQFPIFCDIVVQL